jgi:hypothetical protein
MKNLGMFCVLLACFGLESCKDNQNSKEIKKTDESISVECYRALYEKDSIDLKVNTLKNGKVTGNMEIKFFNMPKKIGKINGEFRGDTLFVDYNFMEATNDKKTFKNPMAFLKRGDELVLGNGKIVNYIYMGRSYIDKDIPIDFDKVKFKFKTIDCDSE